MNKQANNPAEDEFDGEEFDFEIELEDEAAEPAVEKPSEKEKPESDDEKEETPSKPSDLDSESSDDDESNADELSEEDKARMGRRAQKRIRQLNREKKEWEEKYKSLETRLGEVETENKQNSGRVQASQRAAIEQKEAHLKSEEESAKAAMKTARQSGDDDAELAAFDRLSAVRAEQMIVGEYRKRLPAKSEDSSPPQKEQARQEDKELTTRREPQDRVPEPSTRTKRWHKANSWFGDNRVMTAAAAAIHEEIVEEGFDPGEDEDEYFTELDRRLQKEFPKLKKTQKTSTNVDSGASASAAPRKTKTKVRLSENELRRAKEWGISKEEYAKEKLKVMKKRGEV